MARLAAYYQEDFQYPPVGHHGPKQRKSAYVYYEEPKNNFLNNYPLDSERVRSLATSEPSLSPLLIHSCKPNKMTLKNKPLVYGNQLVENSHPQMQYFDNDHNSHYTNNRFSRLQGDIYDNESFFTDERPIYDERYIPNYRHTPKDKARKRFSYVEPQRNIYSPEVYTPQNNYKYHSQSPMEPNFDMYDNRSQYPSENYYFEPSPNSISPSSPAYYHNGSNYGNWQQWTQAPEVFANRRLLSPPSPLDSGLSSQSITSSPSLEPDLFPSHSESVPAGRFEHDHVCLCPNQTFSDGRSHGPNLSRHDSGRSSGVYSVYRYPKESRVPHLPVARDNINHNGHPNGQVRYGKLGLVGEPLNNGSSNNKPKKKHDNSYKRGHTPLESMYEVCYEVENGAARRNSPSKTSKSHNRHPNLEKPFVVVTEASENDMTSCEDTVSHDKDNSEKSDMDSSASTPVSHSTSKSSSVSSCNNELTCSERRKPSRTTEKEIRELEDMYEKCNLGDADLLDRAERRDLPTAHQRKREEPNPRLKRSKSDTLYETIRPMFHNPYEIPQRAPPLRRSGLPDRVADDMAKRKLCKSATTSSSNVTKNTITYMLCSSHFTPTVPGSKDILYMDYPDVEFDDLSYRNHYFGKKSKVADPQPPFGIPLRPPPPQKVFSDYLHVIPSGGPQPLCHPRGNPDVVRDDLAFRALRKDEPDRVYYDMSQIYKMGKN